MNKQEMLDKLGTTETEWNSYLTKTSKFIKEDLDDGERELHKRIFSRSTLAILPMDAVDPQELSGLYEAQKMLATGVFDERNWCVRFMIMGQIKEQI
jgi:hypothetical protein